MNRISRFSNCLCVVALTGTLVLSSDMCLAASPQQPAQSASNNQNGSAALPEAPQPQSAQSPQQTQQTPSGAAGAPGATPKGTPVAQPAGAAVAPAKQRGHRSLLIKVGLIVGGAAAVGTVIALSEKSPNRPPGTAASNR